VRSQPSAVARQYIKDHLLGPKAVPDWGSQLDPLADRDPKCGLLPGALAEDDANAVTIFSRWQAERLHTLAMTLAASAGAGAAESSARQ